MSGAELPAGTVTFLFTDVEGSTRLLGQLGQEPYSAALDEQRRILLAAFAAHDGRVVDTQGDSFFVVFRRAREAVLAAVEGQRGLAAHEWSAGAAVRVRMGLHTGEPLVGEERYVGMGVHRAARIGDAGHGGQVLLSPSTRQLLRDDPPEGIELRDLGLRRLKGLDEPERIYQILAPGLQPDFPPLRTGATRFHRLARERRGRLVLGALVLALAGSAALVAVLVSSSSAAKPVRLLPDSLAVFDPSTGRPVGDVPLDFTPGGVVAGGDQIWVLDSAGRSVTAVDPTTLSVQRTVGLDVTTIPRRPDVGTQWASGRTEWIAGDGAVEQLSADEPGASTISLWKPLSAGGQSAFRDRCPALVTGAGKRVFVSEGRHFAALDAKSGTVLTSLILPAVSGAPTGPYLSGGTCYGVSYEGGRLLAVRDPDESLGYLDSRTGGFVVIASGIIGNTSNTDAAYLGGATTVWSAGFGSAWLASSRGNTEGLASPVTSRASLTRLDLGSGEVLTKTVVGQGIAGLVTDARSGVWILDAGVQQLVGVDPRSGQRFAATPLPHFPSSIAAGHGRIWVTLQSP